jgi:hypothetical protein
VDSNAAWLEIVLAATDLVTWSKLLGYTDHPELARCEINTFRYRPQRLRKIHWPWESPPRPATRDCPTMTSPPEADRTRPPATKHHQPHPGRKIEASAREVLTSILDIAAPNSMVLQAHAECDVTDQGKPTRRAKIRYLLSRKGIADVSADQFVEADIDNALSLFTMFNKGTHGVAGRFSIPQPSALRNRVEASIGFLNSIS